MIYFNYIINNGKYESQTSDRSGAISKANGFAYRGREANFRALSSSTFDSTSSATVGKTDQKSDYESLRLKFLRKY